MDNVDSGELMKKHREQVNDTPEPKLIEMQEDKENEIPKGEKTGEE